jgi:ParB family chromosome partitioning protein
MPLLISKNEKQIEMIKTDKLSSSTFQPRKLFSDKSIKELAESIKQHGILQPLLATKGENGNYILVAGERRLRAAKLCNLKTVPVILLSKNEKDYAAIALIENIQREQLSFFEEAQSYQRLITDYGMTQSEIATALGKKQSTISNKMRILRLPPTAQALIVANSLTERHARELLRISNNQLLYQILDKIIAKNLNVEQTSELISSFLTEKPKKPQVSVKIGEIKLCLNTINKALRLIKKSGIKPQTHLQESEGFVEYIIKIPKTS